VSQNPVGDAGAAMENGGDLDFREPLNFLPEQKALRQETFMNSVCTAALVSGPAWHKPALRCLEIIGGGRS